MTAETWTARAKLTSFHVAHFIAPSELAIEPWQPIAMPGDGFCFRQMPADLDHIAHDVLGQSTDGTSMLGLHVADS